MSEKMTDQTSAVQPDVPNEEKNNAKEDEVLTAQAQAGDHLAMETLLDKYKNLVRTKARSYFLIGADHEDIVQEGMIGLFKAIRDFQPDRQTTFRSFAELCIKRQIITAIKAATRLKHIPLNSYVSLNKPLYDEENERTLLDVLSTHANNPEDLFISQEELRGIQQQINELLSDLERQALGCFMEGMSYQEIAVKLGRHSKCIDNALQRVKKKLLKYIEESHAADM